METLTKNDDQLINEQTLNAKIERRSFLRYAGAGVAGASLLAACSKSDKFINTGGATTTTSYDVGLADVGVLNYAYALEQLEAAFYIQAVSSSGFSQLSSTEQSYLTDIRDHEVCHREFFKAAITSVSALAVLPLLTPNFASIDFTTRTGILTQAKAFEDTGVSAYNGIAYFIVTPTYLILAGKIVSVEARHAALIHDLLNYGSFADGSTLNSQSLDTSRTPSQVLPIANSYLASTSQLTAIYLPK